MKHVIHLHKYRDELMRTISDLEWERKEVPIGLKQTLESVNQRLANGELYQPLF